MRLHTFVIPALLFFASPLLHAEVASPAPVSAASQPAKPVAGASARININTADAVTLLALKGVGEKKAQAIVSYRKSKGPFNSLEQFEAVPGIGPSIVAKNKNAIVFR